VTLIISGIFALYFFFVTVPAAPLAIVILPVLLGLVYLGLRRNRLSSVEGSTLESLQGQVSIWKIISLLALPLTSTLVYAAAMWLNVQWQTTWILYLITTPLGFILFGVSMYRMMKQPRSLISRSVGEEGSTHQVLGLAGEQ
jgi:hypothetical protein